MRFIVLVIMASNYSEELIAVTQSACAVCRICYEKTPTNRDLLVVYCKNAVHRGFPTQAETLVTWSDKKQLLVPVRPLPSQPRVSRPYSLCNKGAKCPGSVCELPHSEEEMSVWNSLCERRKHNAQAMLPQPVAQSLTTSGHSQGTLPQPNTATLTTASLSYSSSGAASRASVKVKYKERIAKPPCLKDAQAPLTRETYRSKFYSLLYHEEEVHSEILVNRCDGEYLMVIFERGDIPEWIKNGDASSRYACISGMTADQIMYATQASECLYIVDKSSKSSEVLVRAEVLFENFQSYYDEMLIEFTTDKVPLLERHFINGPQECQKKLMVKFEVKHLYFDFLQKSLSLLSDTQIARLFPIPNDSFAAGFCSVPHSIIYDFMKLDKESQLPALDVVTNSKSRAPVLVTGAFGTGKTRLLAVATHFFIEEGKLKNVPTRVLICAHHQVTADSFVEDYFGKMLQDKGRPWHIRVVRIGRAKSFETKNSKFGRLYATCTITNFNKYLFSSELVREKYIVVVTTCLTALNASRTVGDKFFTHILLDEAAQAREPEIVAPLSMANQDTKIVIAGDDRQVGPEILVLGEVPQAHGLAVPLITRLLKLYDGQQDLPVTNLNTNYRCHESIVKLAHSLSYSKNLRACATDTAIPGIPSPIWFVCSSLDKKPPVNKESNQREAKILSDHLQIFFPDDKRDVCVMATNRRQVTNIQFELKALEDQKKVDLRQMQFLPTYLIQGREFKALFMSTVEALDSSGYSLNPTKSLCSPSVFNTAITRAKSLIVAIGNPYTLMDVEEKRPGNETFCWAEYLHRCFMNSAVVFPIETKEKDIDHLQDIVLGKGGIKPPYPTFLPLAPVRIAPKRSRRNRSQKKNSKTKQSQASAKPSPPKAPAKVSPPKAQPKPSNSKAVPKPQTFKTSPPKPQASKAKAPSKPSTPQAPPKPIPQAPSKPTTQASPKPSTKNQFNLVPDEHTFQYKDLAHSILLEKPFVLSSDHGGRIGTKTIGREPYVLLHPYYVKELMDEAPPKPTTKDKAPFKPAPFKPSTPPKPETQAHSKPTNQTPQPPNPQPPLKPLSLSPQLPLTHSSKESSLSSPETQASLLQSSTTPSALSTPNSTSIPITTTSAYFVTGRDIFLGLNASASHLTAIFVGPNKNTQTTFNPRVVRKGANDCVIQLPAISQPGVFTLLILNSKSTFSELFQLNMFDPSAVTLQPCSQTTFHVNQKLRWAIDCSNAGPGFVSCQINGDYVAAEQSPQESCHVISFTPYSVGSYTLEVMYNSYDTGNTVLFHVK